MTKVIKTAAEYKAALEAFDQLVALSPEPGTPDGDALELQILLIDEYESRAFPFESPDPVEAILFRMEQQGLSQRDLVPLLGSRAKVSEVLSRQRPLTLQQIRALHEGLGLPASILIQESQAREDEDVDWGRFPVREMVNRHWLPTAEKGADTLILLRQWFESIPGSRYALAGARLRTSAIRGKRTMDPYALSAWAARIVQKASAMSSEEYVATNLNPERMTSMSKLSRADDGVVLAQRELQDMGIRLVVENHLPKTHLDGAALVLPEVGGPVIGLTLRYDRVDNFWFTLMHELAHLYLHIGDMTGVFFDDLEYQTMLESQEAEADELARNVLIPLDAWNSSPARVLSSPYAAETLADQLGISPAIVAGRMRYELRAYRLLTHMLGQGEVRKQFGVV